MTDKTDLATSDEAPTPADEPTTATDGDPSEPEQTFADFGVDAALVDALDAKGIVHPFPIQALTLPMALQGHDIIGQARTGTGKTLAFGLPLLQRVDPDKKRVQALVITPTRELTVQVADDLGIGAALDLHVTAVYGGVPIEPQTDALLGGAQVVVGTPGRLLDHVGRGNLDLSGCTQLVLDEADEMLDMGFLPDIERLVDAIGGGERHTMLFSATMPPAIVSLARRYMDSPTFLRAASDEPETAPTVDQYFMHVHRMDKPRVLARIMQTPDRGGAFVFTRTKMMASRLVGDLEAMGIAAVEVHGDLRQAARERNLDKFRRGKADILVATEVAARGLDVDNVTHVVNYDCPDDHKMYLHRIGRTARAGAKGVAVTFCEYNEIDRVNVIRKTIDAHDGEDPIEIFSSSDLLTDWFDLPEETPWAAQRRKRRENKSGDGASGRGRRTDGRESRNRDDRGGSDRGGSGRSGGGRSGGGRSGGGRSGGGRDDGSKRSKGRNEQSRPERDDSRSDGAGQGAATRAADDAAKQERPQPRTRKPAASTAASPDETTVETRTRTRTRVREDAARGRARDERDDNADRAANTKSTGRDDDRSDGSGKAPRKRARTNRSGGRQAGNKDASDRNDDRDRNDGRDRDGGRDGGRDGRTRQGGRGGGSANGRDGGQRGQRRDGRTSHGAGRESGAGRSTRTTADRPTRRGDDARGDGSPGLARRVVVENLP